jgi:diguanylate cyclase (GGDEF)-like protein
MKNHRAFQEALELECDRTRRYGNPVSLIMLDVDYFKQFNDAYGHPGGDDVLKKVASILAETAREADFVARYGGEEFAIIAPETSQAGAVAVAERLRAAIERYDWPLRKVTASFGVATSSMAAAVPTDLVVDADKALYHSKGRGRNRVSHVTDLDSEPAIPASMSG